MKTATVAAGCLCLAAMSSAAAQAHRPGIGLALRGGTLGFGGDLDFRINDSLNARVGYAGFNTSRSVSDTQVHYDGSLKLSNASALVDWSPFGGKFRLTVGAIVSSTKIVASGAPAAGGKYTFNGNTYSRTDVGAVTGRFEVGSSVAPYVGLGFGNVVFGNGHWSFLFDVGTLYAGTPTISVNATCKSADASVCAQLLADVNAEQAKLSRDLTVLKWYPVVTFGFGYRF